MEQDPAADLPASDPRAAEPPTAALSAGAGLSAQAVAERVAAILRDRIVKGDLKPGDRIVERKLSADLNVSRTPIREALKLLRADGLIEISLHRGAQVTAFTATEALALFDVIAALESLAARHLAGSLTPAALDALEALHAQVLQHYRSGEIDAYFAANSAVHDRIIAQCGNPVLAESHGRLIMRARRGRFLAIMDAGRWAQAVDEHEALMVALRARSPAVAADVWDRHLRHTGETLAAILRAHDGGAEAGSA